MRTVSELEQVIENTAAGATNEIYDALIATNADTDDITDPYQTILEIIVNDILKQKKK